MEQNKQMIFLFLIFYLWPQISGKIKLKVNSCIKFGLAWPTVNLPDQYKFHPPIHSCPNLLVLNWIKEKLINWPLLCSISKSRHPSSRIVARWSAYIRFISKSYWRNWSKQFNRFFHLFKIQPQLLETYKQFNFVIFHILWC